MWPFASVDPIPATETKRQLRDRFYKSDGDGQRRILRGLRKQCDSLGHDFGEVEAVFSSGGRKGADELGNRIAYHVRVCQRCGLREPISEEDARYKANMDAQHLALYRQHGYAGTELPMDCPPWP